MRRRHPVTQQCASPNWRDESNSNDHYDLADQRGGAVFTLTITGTNFVPTSVVNFGGTAPTTTFVSATQLTVAIPAAAVASVGTAAVTVTNPAPGAGTSNVVNFTIANGTTNPTSVAVAPDPTRKFGYVANYGSNSVSMYSIDPATGVLTLIGTIGT